MIPFDVATGFFGIAMLLALTPGPDNLFVLTQSTLQGRLAGIVVTIGLCSGIVIHTTAVALGVAAIFATSNVAFNVLKLMGAAYLIYLAWQAFRADVTVAASTATPTIALATLYRRGFIMNITNPKVSIFFLAFLPQFTDPGRGPVWLQIILFGLLFMLATILVFGGIAFLAGGVANKLNQSATVQRWLNRIAGSIFLALAVNLLLAQRS